MAENAVYDGTATFIGGQDASKSPDKIPEVCYASGINLDTSNANLRHRWPVERKFFNFPSIDDVYFELPTLQRRSYEEIFQSGKFQAIAPYSIGSDLFLVVVIAGIIYLLNQNTYEVTVVSTTPDLRLDETVDRVNWNPAESYLVFYDYPNYPLVLEGFNLKRSSDFLYGIPISNMGVYVQNRLAIANAGNVFTLGDPTGNPLTPDAPITYTEILAPQSLYIGQEFALPTGIGTSPITAMTVLSLNDTSTGIGPLVIGTEKSVFTFQAQQPRPTWQTGSFGSAYVRQFGMVGQRAHITIGSDLYFMSPDGFVRSANMSRAEQNKYSKAPISNEVKNWIKFNEIDLAKFTAFSYFNNKFFVTANPIRTPALTTTRFKTVDYAFLGACVMAFDNASNLSSDAPPVWEGLWTGVRPMDYAENGGRFFVIAKDESSINRIYEYKPNAYVDKAGKVERQIRSRVYSRQMDCKAPFQNKDVNSLDLDFASMKGEFSVEAKYRPGQAEIFLPWRKFRHNVPYRTCNVPTEKAFLTGFQGQQFRSLVMGSPPKPNACNEVTNEMYTPFREIQLQLTIEGAYWELNKFRLKATVRPQPDVQDTCNERPAAPLAQQCNDDWVVKEFNECLPQAL